MPISRARLVGVESVGAAFVWAEGVEDAGLKPGATRALDANIAVKKIASVERRDFIEAHRMGALERKFWRKSVENRGEIQGVAKTRYRSD